MTKLARRYNRLIDSHEQADVPSQHEDLLTRLQLRYRLEAIFRLHLIHGHFRISGSIVMLGSRFRGNSSGYWTKIVPYEEISGTEGVLGLDI